jgi:hypothetical protein
MLKVLSGLRQAADALKHSSIPLNTYDCIMGRLGSFRMTHRKQDYVIKIQQDQLYSV